MDRPAQSLPGVEAMVEYIAPHCGPTLRYLGDGQEVNTGAFERHTVFVADARALTPRPTLASAGFELARHTSGVDFYDDQGAETAYAHEIEPLLLALTRADKAVLFGARRRHTGPISPQTLPGASDVHVDYAAPDARRMALALLGPEGEAGMPYRRFMAVNLWRSLSPPPQDRPLAICDGRSVVTQGGVFNTLMLVDAIPPPEARPSEPPPDPAARRGFLFHHDPAHLWRYYPDMGPDEVVLFKLYDSTETGPWRCPHVSFVDPTVQGAPPRESYEIRSFVYFR